MRHPTAEQIGVAVIGAGSIGLLRAHLCATNPTVDYLVVCDIDRAKADAVAGRCSADRVTTSHVEAVEDPRVGAVIVATSEGDHFEPAIAAIRTGKPLMVEKPLTVAVEEGRELVAQADAHGTPLTVGFTQRFRRRYLGAKEHLARGYLGEMTTLNAKLYVTRAVGEAIIRRAPTTTPSINTLTYCADLALWYLEGCRPMTVFARHSHGELSETYGVADATWAIVTFSDGTVANLGVSWEPPRTHPAYVAAMEVELFGRNGMLTISDRHADALLVSDTPVPSPYTPSVTMGAVHLGSAMPGDWAAGRFYGPMRDETELFVEGAIAGEFAEVLPTGAHGLAVLELTHAIDVSADTDSVVDPCTML